MEKTFKDDTCRQENESGNLLGVRGGAEDEGRFFKLFIVTYFALYFGKKNQKTKNVIWLQYLDWYHLKSRFSILKKRPRGKNKIIKKYQYKSSAVHCYFQETFHVY